jgi:hypothetical protein
MCYTTKARCTSEVGLHRSPDLEAVVRHYRANHQNRAVRELGFFRSQRTFAGAIEKAAMAEGPDGKRFAHQRRIPRSALEFSLRRLRPIARRLRLARTFAGMYTIVEGELRDIQKIGPLVIYDTALRIAAWRGLEPENVYLHAGTRVGAKALGLDVRRPTIPMAEIPRALRQLRPHEIEDVLCIYKGVF